jgi:hypothetical protein
MTKILHMVSVLAKLGVQVSSPNGAKAVCQSLILIMK